MSLRAGRAAMLYFTTRKWRAAGIDGLRFGREARLRGVSDNGRENARETPVDAPEPSRPLYNILILRQKYRVWGEPRRPKGGGDLRVFYATLFGNRAKRAV